MLLIRNLLRVTWEVTRFAASERSLLLVLILVPTAIIVALGIVVAVSAPVIYPFL